MFFISLAALLLRLYGLTWDQGWHLHPDERMLIMVADRIQFFSQMNPDFFNYGSLPIYILKGSVTLWDKAFGTHYATYDGMLFFGRSLSVLLDLIVLKLVYWTALKLFGNKKIALFSAFIYAFSFFPIQNTHFFIVDNFLNLFITATIYFCISYFKQPRWYYVALMAIMSAAAITTKATALVLLPVPIVALLLPRSHTSIIKNILYTKIRIILFAALLCVCAYVFMPYAFVFTPYGPILNPRMVSDILLQIQMNSNPFVFPYTLQYVGTLPYLYYIKNIVLWGLGPIQSILAVIGGIFMLLSVSELLVQMKKTSLKKNIRNLIHSLLLPIQSAPLLWIIYWGFYMAFFLVLGRSAVKFMRYMLPLYAPLSVMAGYGMYEVYMRAQKAPRLKPYKLDKALPLGIMVACILWVCMFVQIYNQEHTRITASKWVFNTIPPASTIAIEHWDDRLPLPLQPDMYQYAELPLYDPDAPPKWEIVNNALARADYYIIASNRLYVPLMKMTDCTKLPEYRCYQQTAQFYKDLFAGNRGYTKVAEFAVYPSLGVGPFKLQINDQGSDESFTVYDHPKIMIYKKSK